MEISGNSLNQPVNFYTKNTGNTINLAINDPSLPITNVFAPEFESKEKIKNISQNTKRKKNKNKRLNTFDTDYLPDEVQEAETPENNKNNIFSSQDENRIKNNLKKTIEHIVTTIPLINYCYLRQKERTLKNAVNTLTGINQNVDELLNISVPIGEETAVYKDIANNLNNAVHIIGTTNKEI